MRLRRGALASLVAIVAACGGDAPTVPKDTGNPTSPTPPGGTTTSAFTVPAITREFRGMWIATVANIDWPSATTLSAAQQQVELDALVSTAQSIGLNAVILQVRAAGDALYPSSVEPWSRSLTGVQGRDPGWDPLAYAVTQAHQRGLELHAWFNPFRAANLSDTATLAASHFARRRPDLTRPYCTQLWFDPAESAVQDQAMAAIADVLRRYAVDAVQIDDFFYPYPDTRCPSLDFPDSASYARYVIGGGALVRADWRRDNVNRFVERMYREVHASWPSVRVGVSPFGIWRPGNPAGVTGLDSYATIYADSRKWLQQGWLDYLAPQLYWSVASTGQSFPALLAWWGQQNSLKRHLWPGLASYRVLDGTSSAYSATEIQAQVSLTRDQAALPGGSTGSILYNASSVKLNRGAFATSLGSSLYSGGAIPPATPWLDAVPPGEPTLAASSVNGSVTFTLGGGSDAYWWLVRWRSSGTWRQKLLPATQRTTDVPSNGLEGVVVTAIDRVGNASPDVVWRP